MNRCRKTFGGKVCKQCFLSMLSYLFLFLLSPIAHSQTSRMITGTVTGDNGVNLAGVSVSIRGTTQGTTTGSDGKYSLTVTSDTATLEFSYVGYATQEIPVAGRTVINVTLASAAQQ